MGISASPNGSGPRGTLIRARSAAGLGGRTMGRERLEMTGLRERRGRNFAEEVRARSPLALPELEWESVVVRLVLKFVFISLKALESSEADLFTGFIGLIPGGRGFRGNPPPKTDWNTSSIHKANPGFANFTPLNRWKTHSHGPLRRQIESLWHYLCQIRSSL